MKDEWKPLAAALLMALFVGLGFGLAISPGHPWLPYEAAINYQRPYYNEATNRQSGNHKSNTNLIAPNEFVGELRANPQNCYQGEKEGECAARIIQEGISSFYLWLVIATGASAFAAFFSTWAIFGQGRILRTQTTTISRQTDISDQIRTGDYWPHLILRDLSFRTLRSARPSGGKPCASYTISFVGKRPVVLRAFRHDLLWCDSLPRIPEIRGWHMTYEPFDPETAQENEVLLQDEITDSLTQEMKGFVRSKRNFRFFLVVATICEDAFGQQHEHAWCFCSGLGGGPGMPYGGQFYNYRRIRKDNERI